MGELSIEATSAPLADQLTALIKQFGVIRAQRMIDKLLQASKIKQFEKDKVELLVLSTILEAQTLFKCERLQLNLYTDSNYSDGRMAAYHLLKKYTNLSYKELGVKFSQSKRAVIHHCNKCEDMLSVAQFHKEFVATYHKLEEHILGFMVKIN